MKLYEHPDVLEYLSEAEAGDAEAQFELGERIRSGVVGVEIPGQSEKSKFPFSGNAWQYFNRETIKWLTKAAEQDHLLAQYNLAEVYARGGGDVENASFWYAKFAQKINDLAKQGDGTQLLDIAGEFISAEWEEEFFATARAAKTGNLRALSDLGDLYCSDYDESLRENLDYGYRVKRRALKLGEENVWQEFSYYFRDNKFAKNKWEFFDMCGNAYSLLVLKHSEDENIRVKAKEVIEALPEVGRQKLYRFWKEFEKCTKDGNLFHGNEITIFLVRRPNDREKYEDFSDVEKLIYTDKGYRGFVEYEAYENDVRKLMENTYWKTKAQGEDSPLWAKMPAQDGDVAFQYLLGIYFNPIFYGEDREWHDLSKAEYWLNKAAEQGHPQAMIDLSELYIGSFQVEGHAQKALEWCQKAAEAYEKNSDGLRCCYSYNPGYSGLEKCYRLGIGVCKDESKADYYKRLSEGKNEGNPKVKNEESETWEEDF